MTQKKQILLALCGLTPQIITETLYGLMIRQKISIEEIWLVTTLSGKELILRELLDEDTGRFWGFCQDFGISPGKIRFGDQQIIVASEITDILSPNDSDVMGEKMLQIVRDLTADENTVLHCSIAGGRKTMSVLMAMIIQFFGRSEDKLYHVLVSPPEFENNRHFYYPPPQPVQIPGINGQMISTEIARIELVEVPYLRLREKVADSLKKENITSNELVNLAQNVIAQTPDILPLEINIKNKRIKIGENKVTFSPIEMAFYLYYAERSLQRSDQVPVRQYDAYFESTYGSYLDEQTMARVIEKYCRLVTPKMYGRYLSTLKNGTIEVNRFCQYLSRIKRKIRKALGDDGLADYYVISAVGKYRKCYGIKVDKAKIKIIG